MTRFRFARFAVGLTLALFLGWLGVGALHHHADQPGCEICKAMHGGAADVPRPAGVHEPALRAETIAPTGTHPIVHRTLPLHSGRAPPTA
jgi:hypothetical protein